MQKEEMSGTRLLTQNSEWFTGGGEFPHTSPVTWPLHEEEKNKKIHTILSHSPEVHTYKIIRNAYPTQINCNISVPMSEHCSFQWYAIIVVKSVTQYRKMSQFGVGVTAVCVVVGNSHMMAVTAQRLRRLKQMTTWSFLEVITQQRLRFVVSNT